MDFSKLKVTVLSARQVETAAKTNDANTRVSVLAGFCEVAVAIDDGTPDGFQLIKSLAGRINVSKGAKGSVQTYVNFKHTDTQGQYNNTLCELDDNFQNFLMGKVIQHIGTNGWSQSAGLESKIAGTIGVSVEELQNFASVAFGAAMNKVASVDLSIKQAPAAAAATDAAIMDDLVNDGKSSI